MEIHFQDVVKLSDLGANARKQALVQRILEESSASWRLGHSKKVSEASILVLPCLVDINQGATGAGCADDRDGQGGEQNERSGLGHVCLGNRWAVFLGAVAQRQRIGRLTEQVVVTVPRSSVEEIVLADQEDTGELLVVVGHHDVLGWPLAEVQQGVDVLNAAETLLPQFELDGNVQLLEASVQVALESIWITQVDRIHLRGVFGGILNVVPEEFAEATELGLAGVLQAELEGLEGGSLVHNLETRIVLQDFQHGTVGFPEELQPGSNDGAVCAVPRLFARDGGKEDSFGRLDGFEIFNIGRGGGRFERLLDFISLCLGLCNLLFSEFDEAS